MIKEKELIISVPASTANLGPGFDSVGLALQKKLTLRVQHYDTWEIIATQEYLKGLPTDKNHFIFKIAEQVAQQFGVTLPPCLIEMNNEIPLARGLGSSASAIIAGIELTNQLCQLNLTNQDKLRFASMLEGHPDNVGASIFGGLVIGSHRTDQTNIVHMKNPDVETVVLIPPYQLLTKDARNVLPTQFSFSNAVEASSISNVLVAALLTDDWELAGEMMELDLFHQPYRSKFIPDIAAIEPVAKANGAYGLALSGAGPTIICFTKVGNGSLLVKQLKTVFPEYQIEMLSVDTEGIQVNWIDKKVVHC